MGGVWGVADVVEEVGGARRGGVWEGEGVGDYVGEEEEFEEFAEDLGKLRE